MFRHVSASSVLTTTNSYSNSTATNFSSDPSLPDRSVKAVRKTTSGSVLPNFQAGEMVVENYLQGPTFASQEREKQDKEDEKSEYVFILFCVFFFLFILLVFLFYFLFLYAFFLDFV
jgi:hypothetical protein